ncbi:hypothetical protein N7G274_003187 [Stereocaulon virgatum]|uniref:Tail specific protease domain-containing protein n=1 Tax=Stereocaulon virgatum TaxID=373712 RepID=A0ABR4AF80_9LECA
MKSSFSFAIMAVEAALVAAHPAISSTSSTEKQTTLKAGQSPCEALSSRADVYLLEYPEANHLRVNPSEIYACLRSTSIDPDRAIAHIDWLLAFLQFQSTVPYLRDPPQTYPLPAVDLVGGLNKIKKTVATGGYGTEYDFELDIYTLINTAKDGHLGYISERIARSPNIHRHSGDVSLVSVSLDGLQVPKIYFHSDIAAFSRSNFIPSAISSINGQEVSQYLEDYTLQSATRFQDLDALYNSIFHGPATTAPKVSHGSFPYLPRSIWGDNTTCVFDNELSLLSSPGNEINPLSATSPTSIIGHTRGVIKGYFLGGPDNSDVAVLNINSFLTTGRRETQEFQDLISKLLESCRTSGKERLVIDIRGNGGGNPLLGLDLFKQLFPNIVPYTGLRFRGSEAINTLGAIASGNMTLDNDPHLDCLSWSIYNARNSLRLPDGPSYNSWQELYPPLQQHGDIFSMVASLKLSNGTLDLIEDGIVVSGYANRSSLPSQVFAGENIVLLTDGQCSSTCAFFANLLINQGHVVSATVGGRPNNQPMAMVGGVQGGLVLRHDWIVSYANQAIHALSKSSASPSRLRKSLEPLARGPPIRSLLTLNTQDMIGQGDESSTPLQFAASMKANCRFYYEPSDMVDINHTWVRVARGIKANGTGLCVNGTLSDTLRTNSPAKIAHSDK